MEKTVRITFSVNRAVRLFISINRIGYTGEIIEK